MKLLCAINPPAHKLTLVYGAFVLLKPDADGRFRLTEHQLKQILPPPKPGERSRCGCFHY